MMESKPLTPGMAATLTNITMKPWVPQDLASHQVIRRLQDDGLLVLNWQPKRKQFLAYVTVAGSQALAATGVKLTCL